MKIAIGTNTFGTYHRQTLALQTLKALKSMFPSIIDLYDVQFADEPNAGFVDSEFKILHELKRSSMDVVQNPTPNKKLPIVKDIFDVLSALPDYDYFIFANSDVMLSNRLIQYIMDSKPTAFACSRLDINHIDSLDQPMIPYRWEVAGFDVFIMQPKWYSENSFRFADFLLGRAWFDHYFAAIMKIYGNNDPYGNKNPPFAVHIHHGFGSLSPNNETTYNTHLYETSNKQIKDIHGEFYMNYLTKRTPYFFFLNEIPNEQQIETEYFERKRRELGVVS